MAIAHWKEKGYTVCLTSTNRIALFWEKRKNARITKAANGFAVQCDAPIAITLPDSAASVTVDGEAAPILSRTVTGRARKYVVLPTAGEHKISVNG